MAAGDIVRYGLSNVHYATGEPGSFNTPVSMPGAVSLTTSPEGDDYTFYADNRAYYVTESNNGYSGTIEMAATNTEFLTTVLGYEEDETSGLTFEATDVQPTSVALMFEISGNEEKQRFVLYGVTFSRVDTEANTTSESIEPDTVSLDFTAIGAQFTIDGETRNIVKAYCDDSDDATAYSKFFTKVPEPGTSAE